ncbi:6-chlorohydroxyquinol-1,2-dioxygenase [bacterium]|nr:6-chlorohydroxyquinol-1,2-dioxygenase [bacterium]
MTSVDLLALREQNSADVVARRLADSVDPDQARVVATIVRHLHQAVREVRPSMQDWRAAVEFLTEVGHASDERRQEWVLLSDLLGVTQLVEEINSTRPKGSTPNTARGPFYRPDAPRLPLGADICLDGVGERLVVTGHIRDLDDRPVAGASIETWQANGHGQYENQQPDLQPEFNLRGCFRADDNGDFTYRTVRPAGYRVPDDGPAGQLLGRMGYPLHRPAHISFLISAPGFDTLSTQVYDRADTHLDRDPLYGVKPELVADLRRAPSSGSAPSWCLDFTFVLARSRRVVR